MKNENIPADIKSKSIKEARDEINEILSKLEKNDADLEASAKDYERLIKLNKDDKISSVAKIEIIDDENKE